MSSVECRMKASNVWVDLDGKTHVTMQALYRPEGSLSEEIFSDPTAKGEIALIIPVGKTEAQCFIQNKKYLVTFTEIS